MREKQDMVRREELFAVVEKSLRAHVDDRRQTAPTAVQRLKSAIDAAANAKVCLSALQDLRAAMTREATARRDLNRRCDLLEAALRHARLDGNDAGSTAAIPASLEIGSRESTAEASSFEERLAHVFGTSAPSSLAVLRIGFDSIEVMTVEFGSEVVARLLRIASSRIAHALRPGDIVNRIGNEGLACVMLELPSREHLTHLACKMIDLLSQPMQLDERQFAVCPSIGIAMCPADGATPGELIATATEAMRRARDQQSQYAFSDARAEIWASQFSGLGEE